jgi:hypothetical protein
VTKVGPSISGTTSSSTTLSATIDENGTGYYLVQAASAAAPSVAAVQAGTAFPMTANVAAAQSISGLTPSTAYTVYFVAKDASGNVQAAVQSVSVMTQGGTEPLGGIITTPSALAQSFDPAACPYSVAEMNNSCNANVVGDFVLTMDNGCTLSKTGSVVTLIGQGKVITAQLDESCADSGHCDSAGEGYEPFTNPPILDFQLNVSDYSFANGSHSEIYLNVKNNNIDGLSGFYSPPTNGSIFDYVSIVCKVAGQ